MSQTLARLSALSVAIVSLILASNSPVVSGGVDKAREISRTNLLFAVSTARQASDVTFAPRKIVVSGRLEIHSWFLRADEIEFRTDAELVFARDALRQHPKVFIVVRRILIADTNKPGRITYQREVNRGYPASVNARPANEAPSLTMFVGSIPTVGPVVDFSNQILRAGYGDFGRATSLRPHGCPSRDGHLTGRRGAESGTVVLVSYPENMSSLTRLFHLDTDRSIGGDGDLGRKAVPNAPQGTERCRSNVNGFSGDGSANGIAGPAVLPQPTNVLVGSMTRNAFSREFKIDERSYLSWLVDQLSE